MVEWRELEDSAQQLHYVSETGSDLYIQDTHRGRLKKSGDRYHLVYANAGEYTSVFTTNDDLAELEDLVDGLLSEDKNMKTGDNTD